MARPSNREKILTEGLRVVHERGFSGASVRDIASAASVPLGSFTNHFPSKEMFGLEILERYHERVQEVIGKTFHDRSRPVRERVASYFDHVIENLTASNMRGGCLVGNFCAEVADQSEVLRLRLAKIFQDIRDALAQALEEGVASGELAPDLDCLDTAGFIYSSLQGAILIARVVQNPSPIERCRRQILQKVLK
ncbi:MULTISPECIES: TetR/AcrR family transcriptional regulator [Acidocella]|uniref:TetR/AcrR family transcriptional regulator n=1 Tax=Acidocella TaxID=50709 RepID=UPI0004799A28|nr:MULTISPECIES: TetR/AcrR family transcriptional regulator [Acidocella]WBO58790.1 TetR/AcrR family transcriptional regulator [Acidocella sp. MX-AZ03]